MIKAFIFDMDGVIIDSEPVHREIEQSLFRECGINVSEGEHLGFIGSTSHYMWDKLRKKHNLSNTLEELVERNRVIYLDHLNSDETVKPIEGVGELIKELHEKGIKLAVASSSPINVIETVVNTFKLKDYFDILVTGDEVTKSKPEPDIFLHAAEKLGVKPENCIVIEDSSNGVKAAKKAGMKCIGYKNLGSGDQDISTADFIVNSLHQAREMLNNLINDN